MKKTFAESISEQEKYKLQTLQVVDTNRAWEKLHQRLTDDHLISEAINGSDKPVIAPWVRLAASILLLVTAGILIHYFSQRPDTTGLYTLISNNEQNTLVKVLPDGSVVYLAENATLQFEDEFSNIHRLVKLKGEAFFDIERNPGLPFIIHTGSASVQVLGTAFNIRSDHDQDLELFVEHGLVKVGLNSDKLQNMEASAGEMVRLDKGKLTLKHDAGFNASSWKIKRMHFKDETLDNVISVINRNYGSQLLFEHRELKSRLITVTFFDNSLPKIIELLCLSMNLETEERDDGAILLKSKT